MFWAVLSAIGAGADAAYYIVNKKFLRSLEPDLLAAAGFLAAPHGRCAPIHFASPRFFKMRTVACALFSV